MRCPSRRGRRCADAQIQHIYCTVVTGVFLCVEVSRHQLGLLGLGRLKRRAFTVNVCWQNPHADTERSRNLSLRCPPKTCLALSPLLGLRAHLELIAYGTVEASRNRVPSLQQGHVLERLKKAFFPERRAAVMPACRSWHQPKGSRESGFGHGHAWECSSVC